ncbi:MAG: hypothetical protein RBT19_09190 [Tenuifilaceae bacterium]|jgi:hypothetical protein|uniref:hypothetical protein n=1 Tax=Perlabentimonas gracilis TaxID=2715279 RepID=UPI00140878E5|nr:hypothetical protein [Perlabentimonas gracilis]MDX9770527.1 hypothetical protein [Tenuifilaceae bacterium]NHB70089.1 hypothetical protein [Perlabentimonas gracilis]
MNTLKISKNRVRDFLAEKLAKSIIQSELDDLVSVLRYNALGGYERLDDFDLFENLVAALPELELVFLAETDEHYLHIAVKPDYKNEEDAILVDIRKVIQVIV